jgi:hypothetical protein
MKQMIYVLCFLGYGIALQSQTQNITVPKAQRGVVTKLAATWCTFCGGQAWDTYKTMVNDLTPKSLVMTAHRSTTSRLYSATAEKILGAFDPVFYQPFFFFNNKVVGEGDATTGSEMKKQVDNFAAVTTPTAQTGLSVKFNINTRELEVNAKTEFFKATTGEFYTGIYLLEKVVVEQQTNRGANAEHLNVLRTHFGGSEFGFDSGNGAIASGFSKLISTKTTLSSKFSPGNLIVASILWQKIGNNYTVVNSNWTENISSVTVSVRENQALKADFGVLPTIVQEQSLVNFNLPKAGKQVLVQIFDVQGRVAATLFRGNLPAGKHQFNLQRQQLSSRGLYFVRLTVDGEFATRQAIVQ